MSDDAPASLGRRRFLGAAIGAAAVTATGGTAAAMGADDSEAADRTILQQEDTNGDNGDEDGDENGADNGEDEPGPTEVIELGDNWFDPDQLTIEPGTTVEFVWVGSNQHNIVVESQPEGSDWEGHPDLTADGEHAHTFEILGEYEINCTPHPGMDGIIEVVEDAGAAEPEVAPAIPDEAMTLGIATGFGLVATLGFAYVFLKFGGEGPEE